MSGDGFDEPLDGQGEPKSTAEMLITEMARVIEPIAVATEEAAAGDPDELILLLDDMGMDEELLGQSFGQIQSKLTTLLTAWKTINTNVIESQELPDPEDFDDIIDAFGTVFRTIDELSEIEVSHPDIEAIGDRVLDFLLIRYLYRYHRVMHHSFCLCGVIREGIEGHPDKLELSGFGIFLRKPLTAAANEFGWRTQNEFEAVMVLYYLRGILWEFGLTPALAYPDEPEVASLQGQPMAAEQDIEPGLVVPILEMNRTTTIGVKIVPLPGRNSSLPGLAVVPFGVAAVGESLEIGGGWTFNVWVSGQLDGSGFEIRPDEDVQLRRLADGSPVSDSVHGEAKLRYDAVEETGYRTILGDPDGCRLDLGSAAARAAVDYNGKDVVFDVGFPTNGRIAIDMGDGDGFLQSVLPPGGFSHNFDVTVGWSSKTGLYFDRGGTLAISIPQHVDLGLISLNEIFLAVAPTDDGGIDIDAVASVAVSLGPVMGNVERMGLRTSVDFPADGVGNFGLIDVGISIKPPSGVSVSINSGPVSGGGYLYFNPDRHEYAGAVQLRIGTISLNAIGLLTTRLPGGESGYSLVLIITGEFPPLQLGWGFSLNAVGGLVGINRSTEVHALQEGVRTGGLRSVLFPRDVERNAPQIISDLRSFFPPTGGRHVFGPMVRLGWGTPPIVTAEVGLLLELPAPLRLMILGRVKAMLPMEDPALKLPPQVVLQMDALGVLDIGEGRASIDASLIDSKIVEYPLTGDMAMRAAWNRNPGFALSVGGFNPRFTPPEGFPTLRRVALDLSSGDNPRLRCEGYLAVTSNTAQFGARVDLHADISGFNVDGFLGFDALFQFEPFRFDIDFAAKVSVVKGPFRLIVDVNGSLAGPTPWHVKGMARATIGPFPPQELPIDWTFGPREQPPPMPPAQVLPKLATALEDPRNWTAQRPQTDHSFVSYRQVKPEENATLAHPLGNLSVRQRTVPLNVRIDLYGNVPPADYDLFSIKSVKINDKNQESRPEAAIREKFSPAQYFRLSDDQKLSQPAFQEFPAGRRIGNDALGFGGEQDTSQWREQELTYESTYIDRTEDVYNGKISAGTMARETAEGLAERNSVATSPVRMTGTAAFSREETGHEIDITEMTYVVASMDNLLWTDVEGLNNRGATYTEAQQALEAHLRAHPRDEGKLQVVAIHEARNVPPEEVVA